MQHWFKQKRVLLPVLGAALCFLLCACKGATIGTESRRLLSTTAPLSDEVAAVTALCSNLSDSADIDTYVILNDAGTTINGAGAAFAEQTLTITAPGTYSLKGSLSDGKIVVSSDVSGKIKLCLNGVAVTCSTDAPLQVENAEKKVLLLLGEDSVNTFCCTAADVPAAVSGSSAVEIAGEGTLVVTATGNTPALSDAVRLHGAGLSFSGSFAADAAVSIRDSENNEAVSFALQQACETIFVTAPALQNGTVYTLEADGVSAEATAQ